MKFAQRIPEHMAEADPSLIQDLLNIPYTNRVQIELSKTALKQIIQNDLTPRQREIILLKYYQNMSNKEIAKILHLDASSVSRTLTRGKAKIYKLLHVYLEYLCHAKLES
ncbi:MAG: sigma-70 family RNA polymerase sigma factor [Ruminococcus sp.]|nr:sigma-70 family RNA polymerase sigma factor [Ruminococcus sp.]